MPTSGAYFEHNGRRWARADSTAVAPLGWIDPKLLRPDDWYLVRVNSSGKPDDNRS